MKNFINKYSVSKTLRFELKPVKETLENVERNRIIQEDKMRSEEYHEVKQIIDNFYRQFIEKSFAQIDLDFIDWNDLAKMIKKTQEKNLSDKTENQKKIETEETRLRKKIIALFKEQKDYNFDKLFTADLIKKILPEWVKKEAIDESKKAMQLESLNKFKSFDGYFKLLHENRKNIYSEKAIHTSIGHRLVNENFPVFLHNLEAFNKIETMVFPFIENHQSHDNDLTENINNTQYFKGKSVQESIRIIKEGQYFSLLNNFNRLFSQSQIEYYNEEIGLINLMINLYHQQNSKKDKIKTLPLLKKQILSINHKEIRIEAIQNDGKVIAAINQYCTLIEEEGMADLNDLIEQLSSENFDLELIYMNHKNYTDLSQKMFGHWSVINQAIEHHFIQENSASKNNKNYEQKKESYSKNDFSILKLETILKNYYAYVDTDHDLKKERDNGKFLESENPIIAFLKYKGKLNHDANDSEEKDHYKRIKQFSLLFLLEQLEKYIEEFQSIKIAEDSEEMDLIGNEQVEAVISIKNLLDCLQEISRYLSLFLIDEKKSKNTTKDNSFYLKYQTINEKIRKIIPLYNEIRNYLTKKPYRLHKFKLNFNSPTLANGWDINKVDSNLCFILQKDELYYLAILKKGSQLKPEDLMSEEKGDAGYQRLNYKLLPGAAKTLPRVFLSTKGIENYKPSQEILDLYKNGEHKKGDSFKIESLHLLIDFFKEKLPLYKANPKDQYGWDVFHFQFTPTKQYNNIAEFYKEVDHQGYKIWFDMVSEKLVHESVKKGDLYLFQIYNKDFSPESRGGMPNLHTMYFKEIFSDKNMIDTVIKLNGEAELYHREKSIAEDKIVQHDAEKAIIRRTSDKTSQFKYDIIKDRRFTVDKFFFHVPITLNPKSEGEEGAYIMNKQVQEYIQNNKEMNLIGIDRGEKNLIYYTVINLKGEIQKQGSLNSITTKISKDESHEVNYHGKLDQVEKERKEARLKWQSMGKIKDLKAGYLSLAVHEITKLMLEYNAILIMEDLNTGLKRGRQKIEKQIYQNLERMLINKLNYLVIKSKKDDELASIRRGLQLAAQFESFEKMGKQTGFIFYVNPDYTSKIDFKTGFVPFRYFKYENIEKSLERLKAIQKIDFSKKEIVISIDYNQFEKCNFPQGKWDLHILNDENHFRYSWNNKERKVETVDVYVELKSMFEKYSIDLNKDILEQIKEKNTAMVYKILFKYINLVAQMRVSISKDDDFILSPIAYAKDQFYRTNAENDTIPQNSDANGAYHIALKGLFLIEKRINPHQYSEKSVPNLYINNNDWFQYVLERSNK